MFLIIACLFFAVYVTNVIIGATTSAPVVGDVSEMVLLFIAAIAFTVGILKCERDAKSQNKE